MHQRDILLPLALWATGAQASSPFFAEARRAVTSETRDNGSNDQPIALTAPLVVRPAATNQRTGNSQPNESVEDMANRIANSLIAKYSGGRAEARDNNFNVVPAITPSNPNSGGIFQDGSDLTYFIDAKLGSKQKSLYMLLDTGASTTWVMGENCQSEACQIHDEFNSDDSSSYVDTGAEFSVNYGSGSVTGHVIKDKMSIAGLEVTMDFGVANVTSADFKSFPFDGILGLSMNTKSFLTALKDSGLVKSNVFGVSLARASDGNNDGEIAFGGPNPAKYKGDISYTKIVSGTTWSIPMDDVVVNGSPAGVSGVTAYIDTGTSYGFAPPSVVESIFSKIPGAKPTTDEKVVWSVPCDAKVDVAVTFSGKSWAISAKDLIINSGSGSCEGRLFGREVVKGAFLLGDVFLKNVYSVFDMDQGQIGFAAKSAPTSAAPSGTSATSASSTTGTGVTAPTTAATTIAPVSASGSDFGLVSSGSASGSPVADAVPTSHPSQTGNGSHLGHSSILIAIAGLASIMVMTI